jgi:hypothetical protein
VPIVKTVSIRLSTSGAEDTKLKIDRVAARADERASFCSWSALLWLPVADVVKGALQAGPPAGAADDKVADVHEVAAAEHR